MPEPRQPQDSSRLALLGALLRPARRQAAVLAAAAGAAGVLGALYIWLLKDLLSTAFVEGGGRKVLLPAAVLLLVWAARTLADLLAKVARERLARGVELRATEMVLGRLVRLSVGFFDRKTQGELVEAMRADIAGLRLFAASLGQVVIAAAMLLALAVTAVRLEPRLALLAFVVLPLVGFPLAAVGARLRGASHAGARAGIRLQDALLQVFRGIRPIKAYAQEQREVAACLARRAEHQAAAFDIVRNRALAAAALDAGVGLATTGVIAFAAGAAGVTAVPWPSLLAFLLLLLAAMSPMREIVAAYADGRVYGPLLDRLLALLREPDELPQAADPLPPPEPAGALEFRGVSHAFGGRAVLRDVSFSVGPGETVALVGPSGAGKTTLVNLAMRFYDPTDGAVALGGVDLRRLSTAALRETVALVAQEPFLFSATAGDNIAYGRPGAARDDVRAAARRAAIHDDLMELPAGYDTLVGPGGVPLSGGQTQRMNLARAMLRDAPVLLLDEATSALDSQTERRVYDGLAAGRRRATLVVAHRLSTVRDADRIVVLRDGAVECQGTFAEVLERSETFRTMWALQRSGTPPVAAAGSPPAGAVDTAED
jgi:ABC-type multidrug transport system fused ATPase/permease subunit